MNEGHSFSISFHQGEVNFPDNLKIHVNQVSKDDSSKYSYHFIAFNKDNQGNPNIKFIPSFFAALTYLQYDTNFSGLEFKYIVPDENETEIYFERIVRVDNPIFDSLLVTGYVGKDEVVISSLSCPPQRETEAQTQ
ncbi:hypothetical protein NDI39_16855 [Microcoleus sp. ZQ-A2]|nr:hypothetical protein [Microcoleus sp. FACHB-1]